MVARKNIYIITAPMDQKNMVPKKNKPRQTHEDLWNSQLKLANGPRLSTATNNSLNSISITQASEKYNDVIHLAAQLHFQKLRFYTDKLIRYTLASYRSRTTAKPARIHAILIRVHFLFRIS